MLEYIYTETSGLQCQNGLLVMKLCLNIEHIDHWIIIEIIQLKQYVQKSNQETHKEQWLILVLLLEVQS